MPRRCPREWILESEVDICYFTRHKEGQEAHAISGPLLKMINKKPGLYTNIWYI